MGAHLIVWGIHDDVGTEIIFQDVFAEPRTADLIRFIVPQGPDYNAILRTDMPVALRYFLGSMLLHHFVRTSDIDGLAAYGFSDAGNSGEALRVIAPTDLDRHILDMFVQSNAQTSSTESITESISSALRLVPGDATLLFLRSYFEGFYLGNLNRARADVDLLKGILGETNMTLWSEMNLALPEEDYDRILELSERLNPGVPGYGIPFSYRQIALVMSGEFAQAQTELEDEVAEGLVFGLPLWDTIAALLYAIQGDETRFAEAVSRVQASRDLEQSASFITSINNPPPAFYLMGGYVAELSNENLQAVLTYQTGLSLNSQNFLLSWRQGAIAEATGNDTSAFGHYQTAREQAPVPFPTVTYALAQVARRASNALPDGTLTDCEWLAEAFREANENASFYALLLADIRATDAEWACGVVRDT
ncbi:MAG: hypothetical protein HC915_06085 [Anaerolineae bacterium]|nr:hypothetical protein [Anaerolineae bacterium]